MSLSAAAALSGQAPDTGASTPDATANTNAEWWSAIPDEGVRNWTAAKGFKNPFAVAESAYNLEKLMGFDRAGRTLVVPDNDATPEQIQAFRSKLGVPDSPEGYSFAQEAAKPDEFTLQAAKVMQEAGVPTGAAEKLVEWVSGAAKAQAEIADQQFATQSAVDFEAWKAAQGAAFNQNLELSRRAINQFLPAGDGKTPMDTFSAIERAIGTRAALEFITKIGSGLTEHKVLSGQGSGIMTPEQARQAIAEKQSNPEWAKGYLNGDQAKNRELQELIRMAYPEEG
jgi:hypothetical protein